MSSTRATAVVAGVFFLLAAIAGIIGLALYDPVLTDAGYITGAGDDIRVFLGAFCEVIVAIAVIGTSVTLFPIVKRQNESMALGYIGGRVVEATVIVVGLVSLLAIVSLRQDWASMPGVDPAALYAVAAALVAVHDWTFLLGPNFALGVNTLLLAYLMFRSGFVPRTIAVIGLIGGPLIFASATAVLLGMYDQISMWGTILAVPVFAWEMSLAVWLIVRGFNAPPRAAGDPRFAEAGTTSAIA